MLSGACSNPVPAAATPRRDDRLLARLRDAGRPPARAQVRLTALPQAGQTAPAAIVAEGARRPRQLPLGMTTFLVEHPDTRFLVDPSMCADVHRRVLPELPLPLRVLVAPDRPVTGLAEALDRVGRTMDEIGFVLATHLHWDHVSGLLELPPEVGMRTLAAERDFLLGSEATPSGFARRPLRGRRIDTYELDGPQVHTLPRSHDLMGDGSVLLVDLAGHTPGSIGVLLTLAENRRVLLAGDAVWHKLQIDLLREKAPFPGRLVDADRDAAFTTLHRLHALPKSIEVIAGHDRTVAERWS